MKATPRCDRISVTAAEKPYCGICGVPFMNRTTSFRAISALMRFRTVSSSIALCPTWSVSISRPRALDPINNRDELRVAYAGASLFVAHMIGQRPVGVRRNVCERERLQEQQDVAVKRLPKEIGTETSAISDCVKACGANTRPSKVRGPSKTRNASATVIRSVGLVR